HAQWQGAPLIVSLSGTLAQPIEKSGSGSLDLGYNVTAQDLQRGTVWKVSLRSASAAPMRPVAPGRPTVIYSTNAGTMLRVAKTEAQGTITIQHPAGDMRLAEQQLKSLAGNHRAAAKQQLSDIRAQLQQGAEARQAEIQRATADQQARRRQQLMQSLPMASSAAAATVQQFRPGLRQAPTVGQSQPRAVGSAGSHPPPR